MEQKGDDGLIDFSCDSSCCFHDCEIKLDCGERLYASKTVLALSSKVLHDAITACADSSDVIPLIGWTKRDASTFLNLIYPSANLRIRASFLPNQLAIAHQLECDQLKSKLEAFIADHVAIDCFGCEEGESDDDVISITDALAWHRAYHGGARIKVRCEELLLAREDRLHQIATAVLAQEYGLERVTEACIEALAKHYDYVREDPALYKLNGSTIAAIGSKGYERLKLRMKAIQSRLYGARKPAAGANFYSMQLAQRHEGSAAIGGLIGAAMEDAREHERERERERERAAGHSTAVEFYTSRSQDSLPAYWVRRTGSSVL